MSGEKAMTEQGISLRLAHEAIALANRTPEGPAASTPTGGAGA